MIVDFVVTQAKIYGRKKRTRIRDQQDGKRSQKGDLPSTIPRKQDLNMDVHPKISYKLKIHIFRLKIQVQHFT
jgi:hypothetical protein